LFNLKLIMEKERKLKRQKICDNSEETSLQKIQKMGNYSGTASRMMAKMGFKPGKGLGKKDQGRVDIVPASDQRGRHGLGLSIKALNNDVTVDWRDSKVPSADDHFEWLGPYNGPQLEEDWFSVGKRKSSVKDETLFASNETIQTLLVCKSIFDGLERMELRTARSRSNPYEAVKGAIFQNRAAMKMANIDSSFDFIFTSPPDVFDNELMYFADVCAGPGGFSEYVLWRRGWKTKGFGFTLKGENDFRLNAFHSTNSELFEPHYGANDDGDVTNGRNIESFAEFVMKNTNEKGVHLVMADGGFSVAGQENEQEILTKQLLLCQFTTALAILRENGSFLCKTFDMFTPFTVGLVYLLRIAFEKVAIMKPVTSRPANSERYVICTGFRDHAHREVFNYLFKINEELNDLKGSDEDISEVVPNEILFEDSHFVDYVTNLNKQIADEQCKALAKVHDFVKDKSLREDCQSDVRKMCLEKWKIPDQMRKEPALKHPNTFFQELIPQRFEINFLKRSKRLIKTNLCDLDRVFNFRCYPAGSSSTTLLISRGRRNISLWDLSLNKWRPQGEFDIKCELPYGTVLEVEIVKELKGEGKGQHRQNVVHVVDALTIAGQDVTQKHFTERVRLVDLLVTACHRSTRKDLTSVRTKPIFCVEEIEQIFERLTLKRVKGSNWFEPQPCYQSQGPDSFTFAPTGVQFIKISKDPWSIEFSKSQRAKYFYNFMSSVSTFEEPPEAIASFQSSTDQRIFWEWNPEVKVHKDQIKKGTPSNICKDAIVSFIHEKASSLLQNKT